MTMRIELVEVHGKEEIKQQIPLENFPIQLGRGVQESIGFVPLPDCGGAYLSKLHCTIFNRGSALFLADGDPTGKPSHNGVWLDGKLLKKPVLLYPGQIFVLLRPPPCEIQLRVLPGKVAAMEDTLTPAIQQLVKQPDDEAIERLSLAVNALRKDAERNEKLDEQVRGDVASLRAEKSALLAQLEQARTEFAAFRYAFRQWKVQQDRSQKWLVRLLSGTMLCVALFGAVVMSQDEERQAKLIDISLEILLVVAGAGGLVMSENKREPHDSYSDSGDARPQEIAP